MPQWIIEERLTTTAPPEAIWKLWTNLETWPLWDNGVAWAKLTSNFAEGEFIQMKPTAGPKVNCQLLGIVPLHSFTTRSSLPFTTISFIHRMEAGVVTHRVEMKGLLTPIFRRLLGPNIQKGLPDTVRNLVRMAENTDNQG